MKLDGVLVLWTTFVAPMVEALVTGDQPSVHVLKP